MPEPKPTRLTPPPFAEDLLTTEEVARLVGFTIAGIHQSRYRGRPPGSLGISWANRLWFRRSDIQRWLDERLTADFERRWSQRNKPGTRIRTHAAELLLEKKRLERQASKEEEKSS